MITWNYRVFQDDDGDYVLREVVYAEDGTIVSCTENAVEPYGRSLAELAQSLADMTEALALPVLHLTDIPQPASPTLPQHQPTRSSDELRAKLGLSAPLEAARSPSP
jgi:hypothetical protein